MSKTRIMRVREREREEAAHRIVKKEKIYVVDLSFFFFILLV